MPANNRYLICKSCEEFNNTLKLCVKCHCFMPVKTKIASAECPKGKWSSEVKTVEVNPKQHPAK